MNNWKPVIKSLLGHLKEAGFNHSSVDNGGDEGHEKTSSWEDAQDAILAVDESCIALTHDKYPNKKPWVYIVLGNEPFETAADYTVMPELEQAIDKFADHWGDRPCPKF